MNWLWKVLGVKKSIRRSFVALFDRLMGIAGGKSFKTQVAEALSGLRASLESAKNALAGAKIALEKLLKERAKAYEQVDAQYSGMIDEQKKVIAGAETKIEELSAKLDMFKDLLDF